MIIECEIELQLLHIFMLQFYKTNPNQITGKIDLTPPVGSYIEIGYKPHNYSNYLSG